MCFHCLSFTLALNDRHQNFAFLKMDTVMIRVEVMEDSGKAAAK